MQGIDGLHATEAIKILDPNAKIIIVTNYDDPEFRAEAIQLGTKGYVLKENLTELRKVIHTSIKNNNKN
jgi:DNA-binding NarL/FixJ family response regulator